MDILGFDRGLMGFSLGVHIILAVLGIAIPLIILISEILWRRTWDKTYRILARRLSVALAVIFAIGTASGMLVAIELAVLWPKFMALVSQVAILPFYVEVFAFFGESIFLAAYLYSAYRGSESSNARIVFMAIVAVCAALSGVLITMINAFMNTPVGFNIPEYIATGNVTGVQPLAAFATPSTATEVLHVISSSYFAGAFILLAYFAYMLLKSDETTREYYKKVVMVLIIVEIFATALTVFSGIQSISALYHIQPEKYAAIEGDMVPQAYAPEYIGGIPVNGKLEYYIAIPGLQSLLATGSVSGTVPGLSQFPNDTWPPLFVHSLFDPMVGSGFLIGFFLMVLVLLLVLKRRPLDNRIILWLTVLAGLLAVFVLEAGWIMAEVGRQPWIIYNVMTVASAANYSPSVIPIGIAIIVFYIAAVPSAALVIRRFFKNRPLKDELVK